jgi:hypothetical protein
MFLGLNLSNFEFFCIFPESPTYPYRSDLCKNPEKWIWHVACIVLRVVGVVLSLSSGVGVNIYNNPANGKQVLIPEEMSHTLLTN